MSGFCDRRTLIEPLDQCSKNMVEGEMVTVIRVLKDRMYWQSIINRMKKLIGNIADESHSIGSYIVAFSIVNPKIKISSKKFGPYLASVDDGPNPEYTGMLLDG